jgi:MFS family permease
MKVLRSQIERAFGHRDFRLLWIGAFLSFVGSWVQNVAQGWLVFEMTKSEQKLAMVTFFWSLPVSIFGIMAGSLTDRYNKKTMLIWCQVFYALIAFFLAAAVKFGFISYWQILLMSFLNGCIATIEMPARQSMVSDVVPSEDLTAAIPLNAMTFNIARIIGPALGALLLARFSVETCYLVNAISFAALIYAVLAINYMYDKKDIVSPSWDLIFEGARYTLRDVRLRTLFILEAITSIFGLAYLPLMPAIAARQLGLDKVGLGHCYVAVGIGAMTALVLLTTFADKPWRVTMIKTSMAGMGSGLILLGFARSELPALPLLFILGFCVMLQLNATNTLFQILAPEALRGRVLSMHIWALNGLGPIGLLLFGWLANQQRVADQVYKGLPSVSLSIIAQGSIVILGALWGFGQRKHLVGAA